MTILPIIKYQEKKHKIRKSEIKQAILNNDKIEDKLHVIIVISNPCEYTKRWYLANQFIIHMDEFQDIELYIVELAYENQDFHVTNKNNSKHLQLRTTTEPLWHKENLINLGVKYLLPNNWKAVAWIDADVEFENINFANEALKILNGSKDIIQLFSHCIDMDKNENSMQLHTSFGFQYETRKKYCNSGNDFFHPGFSWACTRKAYEKMDGLFDYSILGSGDFNMAMALIGCNDSVNTNVSDGYKLKINELVKKMSSLRLGYVPGVIKHHFHGSKANRKYNDRWKILVKYQYNPYIHVTKDKQGLLIPTPECPKELLDDILNYFRERLEDE